MKIELSFLVLACAAAVGCASHPPPNDNLASAIAAVRGAQVAVSSAGRVPKAQLQLRLAEEEIAQARQMISRGDHERANYMTLRAYNDAELALALAREHQARSGVNNVEEQPPAAGGVTPAVEPTAEPAPTSSTP